MATKSRYVAYAKIAGSKKTAAKDRGKTASVLRRMQLMKREVKHND